MQIKKSWSTIIAITILYTTRSLAQCDPATIKDMSTVYSKEYSVSYKPTPEQEKYLASIFTAVVEPAIKITKGLRGNWNPMGNFNVTAEGLTKSILQSYLATLGCKNNKILEKHESGLVLNFTINSLTGFIGKDIAIECTHEETKWKKFDDSKTVYIDDVFEGRQVYYLQHNAATKDYPNVAFYRKTSDGEYFVVTKSDVPFFIPLTRREALEINKKNTSNLLEEAKKAAAMPGLQPETKTEYEKRMAKDFADYRSSIPNPEKFINDLIKQLEELKPTMIKQQQFFIDSYEKQITLITNYLKKTNASELDKPCVTESVGLLAAFFGENSDEVSNIKSNFRDVEDGRSGMLVTLNPAYFNKVISKTAPQFISIGVRIQTDDAITQKAYIDFKNGLDFKKLQLQLAK